MHGVRLVVSDDHAGLKTARHATMPGVPWQRCQFHTSNEASLLRLVSAVFSEISRAFGRNLGLAKTIRKTAHYHARPCQKRLPSYGRATHVIKRTSAASRLQPEHLVLQDLSVDGVALLAVGDDQAR